MAIIFNGTSVTRVIKDGVDIDVLKYGNVEVFRKRKLTINFTGAYDAQYSTYPLIIRSTNVAAVSVYGSSVTKEIYIPHGDTVYIDLTKYVQYGTARNRPFYDESYFSLEYPGMDLNIPPERDFSGYNGFAFTMDKDIVINPTTTNAKMGKLTDTTEGSRTYAWVEFYAKTTNALTNARIVKL